MIKYILILVAIGLVISQESETQNVDIIKIKPEATHGCAMYGCQCLDDRIKMPTFPCPETKCYSRANCILLPNGECGFEMTRELKRCLRRPKCEYLGCSVCGVDNGIVPECARSERWQCYNYGKCLSIAGECQWLKTKQMRECLANIEDTEP